MGNRKRTVLIAALGALLIFDALVIVAYRGSGGRDFAQTVGSGGPEGGGGAASPREHNAEALLHRARQAADLGQWEAALKGLDRLNSEYADTRFFAEHNVAIAQLRGNAEAALRPPPVEPPEDPRDPLKAWPVVFEDPLTDQSCLGRALLARGQYGGRFDIRGALIVSGMHTSSAAWWNCPVGETFALSTDLKSVAGQPCIWLCGPGYGNSVDLAYTLRMAVEDDRLTIELHKDGKPIGLPLQKAPFLRGDWRHFDLVKDKGLMVVYLDGEKLGEWSDPAPLQGPRHSFVALGAIQGLHGDDGAWYRNLAIRMPQAEADRLAANPVERLFDPPATTPPQENGKAIAVDEFGDEGLSQWAIAWSREWVQKKGGGIALCGPNAWPLLWRKEPFQGDVVVEFQFSYLPRGEALNFHGFLRFGELIGGKAEKFQGWSVVFPKGDGRILLEWHDEQGDAHCLASTPYFVPTNDRPYALRLEKNGDRLRVFSNGRFLLDAVSPGHIPADAPVYAGILQAFGGSLVRRVAAFRLR